MLEAYKLLIVKHEDEDRHQEIPIIKVVAFLESAPISNLLSTSKIGIHVEPLTRACSIKTKISISR